MGWAPQPRGHGLVSRTTELGTRHYWGRIWRPGWAKALGIWSRPVRTVLLGQKLEFVVRALVACYGG